MTKGEALVERLTRAAELVEWLNTGPPRFEGDASALESPPRVMREAAAALAAAEKHIEVLQAKIDADRNCASAQERIAELEGALWRDLNVTNDELVRIRNMAEPKADGEVRIWGKMLLKLIDAILAARARTTEKMDG